MYELYVNVYTGDNVGSHSRYMISCGDKDGDIHFPHSAACNLVDLYISLKVPLQCAVSSYHWSQPSNGICFLPMQTRYIGIFH